MTGARRFDPPPSAGVFAEVWQIAGHPRGTWRHQLVATIMAAAASLSCGSGHATLQIAAPSTVVAGAPFSATVTAVYNGQRDTAINGPIHFTTTDKAANLPTLYVFTASDAGSHTFTNLVLVTPGTQTVTVSDYDATPIAGNTTIVVTAGGSNAQIGPSVPPPERTTANAMKSEPLSSSGAGTLARGLYATTGKRTGVSAPHRLSCRNHRTMHSGASQTL